MMSSTKVRILVACFGLGFCFVIFAWRLVDLQVVQHETYAKEAAKKHGLKRDIPATRGTIADVHGEILADNEPMRIVVADPSVMKEGTKDRVTNIVASTLGLERSEVARKIETGGQYVRLKKRVPAALAGDLDAKLRSEGLRGINYEPDQRRIYPNGQMLCHVLGFLNSTDDGVDGVERTLNTWLRGSDGFRYIERTCDGKEIVAFRGQERAARNGHNARLTIDMGLQAIVERELDTAVRQYKPKAAIVIMMRPQTGEILAMANRPNFDLNTVSEAKPEQMKNRAIIDMVEPGSTFKIVTAAAAIQEKAADLDSIIFCENGTFTYGGRALHDHEGYGDMTVEDVLAHSSNIGAAKLGLRLGEQRLYEYVRRFGFGERTGVNLPGEINGLVYPPSKWSKISITRIPMGHEVGVTPMQVVTAMSVIANRGKLMMPQIVHDISDEDRRVIQSFQPMEVRRVISEATAEKINKALTKVVSDKGTAALAKVPGFPCAGKTGTAQKPDSKGGYAPGKYVVSFVGYLPADDPAFAIVVMMDEAKTRPGLYYGGLVCGPVFRQIAEQSARYLNLEPQQEEPPTTTLTKAGTRER